MRFAAPPRDEPSLGPPRAGFVRLTGLDLDAKVPADSEVHSSWGRTSIQVGVSKQRHEQWSVDFTIDSPIGSIDEALEALPGNDPRKRLHEATRCQETRDGWLIICRLSWDGSPYPTVTIRRRLGHMSVDVHADDLYLDAEHVLAIAESLMVVPGGVHTWPVPSGEPIVRAGFGVGCFGGGRGDVALWQDGAAQYTGPRYRTQRGRFAQVDAALVTELHERIKSSPCCTDPEYVYDKPFELHVREGDQWRACAGRDIEERFDEVVVFTGLSRE